jgi:hypothetical protein
MDAHKPAHVHVFARGWEPVVNLNQSPAYVSVREIKGFKTREIAGILRLAQLHRDLLSMSHPATITSCPP